MTAGFLVLASNRWDVKTTKHNPRHIPMEAFGWDYTLKMNVCLYASRPSSSRSAPPPESSSDLPLHVHQFTARCSDILRLVQPSFLCFPLLFLPLPSATRGKKTYRVTPSDVWWTHSEMYLYVYLHIWKEEQYERTDFFPSALKWACLFFFFSLTFSASFDVKTRVMSRVSPSRQWADTSHFINLTAH